MKIISNKPLNLYLNKVTPNFASEFSTSTVMKDNIKENLVSEYHLLMFCSDGARTLVDYII